MSVPKLKVGTVAETGGAKDGLPLRRRCVDAATSVCSGVAGIDKALVPSPVAGGVTGPILSQLDVEPDHSRPRRCAVTL